MIEIEAWVAWGEHTLMLRSSTRLLTNMLGGIKVSHHLCLPWNLCLAAPIANVLAHNAACAGRTQFIAACKSRGGEEEGGDRVKVRELAESKQCHHGWSLNGGTIIKRADQLQGRAKPASSSSSFFSILARSLPDPPTSHHLGSIVDNISIQSSH